MSLLIELLGLREVRPKEPANMSSLDHQHQSVKQGSSFFLSSFSNYQEPNLFKSHAIK